MKTIMIESSKLARISAYVTGNKIRVTLEVESQQKVAFKATTLETIRTIKYGKNRQETTSESRRLDCIYDDTPLGFEKDPLTSTKRIHAQEPLKEVNLGNGTIKRPTFISFKIEPSLKSQMIELLREFKGCYT